MIWNKKSIQIMKANLCWDKQVERRIQKEETSHDNGSTTSSTFYYDLLNKYLLIKTGCKVNILMLYFNFLKYIYIYIYIYITRSTS